MTRRGALLFASVGVVWGLPYLMIRVAVRDLSPATLVCVRTALSALLLIPIAAHRRELRAALERWPLVALFAAVEIALPWLLLGSAEQHLTSSLTGLLIAGVPLVGALIQRQTGERERLARANAAGLALGILGVAAIVGLDVRHTGGGPLAEIAVVVVCYAVGPVILARGLAGVPALGVLALSMTLTALAYLPAAVLNVPRHVAFDVVACVVGLAVVCTAVGFVLFFALIDELGPMRATVVTYVNPAVAALLGVIILGETFTVGMGVGFVLVTIGSGLATQRRPVAAPVEIASPG